MERETPFESQLGRDFSQAGGANGQGKFELTRATAFPIDDHLFLTN
jgi:hypothetical protein